MGIEILEYWLIFASLFSCGSDGKRALYFVH
jgi:hypothetical protein